MQSVGRQILVVGRRFARILLIGAVSPVAFLASPVVADGLDRWRVSGLISNISQEVAQPVPGVHLHIMDPSDYLSARDEAGGATVNISALSKRIGGELTAPLDFASAMKIGREAAFVLYSGEMATTLHAMTDRKTLCLVLPSAAPLRLSKLAQSLSGRDETDRLSETEFDAADFYRFLLYHEVAHCAEDPWQFRVWDSGAYDAYLAEGRADAFATLMHVRRTGDTDLPRFIARLRQAGLQHRADFAHQTADVIGPTLDFAMNLHRTKLLADRTVPELLFAARVLVQHHALNRERFGKEVAALENNPQ